MPVAKGWQRKHPARHLAGARAHAAHAISSISLQLYQQYSQYFGMDLSQQEQQITSQLNVPATLGQTVLDQMIDEELVRQEAAKRGITASTEEVERPSRPPIGTIRMARPRRRSRRR